MRLRSGIAAATALTALVASIGLVGCGSTSGSFLATALGITVDWPPLGGRVIQAPDAALSGVFTVDGGSAGGHDVSLTFNRDVGDAGGTRKYELPEKLKVGDHSFVMNFYSDQGGTGSLVASASGSFTVYPNATSSLDQTTVVPTGTIQSVEIAPNQVILVNETKEIAFTARDASGSIVALAPGSAVFNIVSGTSFLSISGTQGTGLAPGVASVTVTVNQGSANPVTSAQQDITVTTGQGNLNLGIQ